MVAGVRVTWPVTKAETSLAPGTKIVVRVSSSKRRSQLSLARVDASGRTMRVIARKTLRSGTFSATLPAAAPARYALRLGLAGRQYRSWITTPAPAPSPAPPKPAPAPTSVSYCGSTPPLPTSEFRAEVHVQTTSVQAGQSLAYTVVSLGKGTINDSASHILAADPATGILGPFGATYTPMTQGVPVAYTQDVPLDTAPGRYRILHTVSWANCDTISTAPMQSEPFEVTAP